MTETLSKMEENRAENQKLLKQKKSLIIKQISTAKSKVPKYLDDIEEKLITEVEDKLYSIQHHVDYRNNQSGRLCVFHSLS
jgi:serine/threonine protein kinase HipA of HipAB toxin-antitoxin module